MTEDENTAKQVMSLIVQCESYSDSQKGDRDKALRNYNGVATEVPEQAGMSKAVSMDLRASVKKLMPSIMRTILANDRIVKYEPIGPGKEAQAEQATDYVNAVTVPESDAERAIYDAIFDALLLKTGVLTWRAYERTSVTVRQFSGQDPQALLGLDEVGEVSDIEQAEDGSVSFTIRARQTRVDVRLQAVPRGAFLIHPNATSIEDSPLVGERQLVTRSDLVSRGYDKDVVWGLPTDDEAADSDAQQRRGTDYDEVAADVAKAMETVTVYDVHVMLDMDGDGIAEPYHVVIADGSSGNDEWPVILEQTPATEVPYAEVVAERDAHQFEGHSLAEDIIPIQSEKTVLKRQMLDNLVWQNNPQPAVQLDAMMDVEALYEPAFGKPIHLKSGFNIGDAVQWNLIPFVADKSFPMMEYLDREVKERTGITDASGGADPDSLQNMSATGAAMLNDAGVAQSDMILRSLANGGIRKAFKGLLGLVIAHADKPRTIMLRGEWVEMDPRSWDTGMDCTINIGLGTGSRERDFAMLNNIYAIQKEIVAGLGADNPFVKPNQLYNTLKSLTETAGLPSADPYFTSPDMEEIAAKQAAKANQPSPEQVKEQSKADLVMQLEQVKAQARSQVEAAQMEADLRVKQAEIEANLIAQQKKLESDLQITRMKGELDLLKHNDKMTLEYDKLGAQEAQVFAQSLPYVPQ